MRTGEYGKFYWCIKSSPSGDGEIYVKADRLEVTGAGTLIAWGGYRATEETLIPAEQQPVLLLAAGHWTVAYAASIHDGSAVAVEHREGEVIR